jgi:hypothetical protein
VTASARATSAKSRTRRAPRPACDLARAFVGHAETHQPRAAPHDRFQLLDRVEIEPHGDAETVPQRGGEQAEAGGRGDERELRKIDLDRARRRPLADDEVELEILHGRIEDFLDGRIEAVDFIDEEHVALFEIGEQRRKVTGLGDHRAPSP